MKKILFLSALFAMSLLTNAQRISRKKIPVLVRKSFVELYPKVTKAKWEKENGGYEACFKLDSKKHSALFDINGNMLESEVVIDKKELSDAILDYVKQKYPTDKIKEVSKITNSSGIVTIEIELKGRDLLFDNEGKFIK